MRSLERRDARLLEPIAVAVRFFERSVFVHSGPQERYQPRSAARESRVAGAEVALRVIGGLGCSCRHAHSPTLPFDATVWRRSDPSTATGPASLPRTCEWWRLAPAHLSLRVCHSRPAYENSRFPSPAGGRWDRHCSQTANSSTDLVSPVGGSRSVQPARCGKVPRSRLHEEKGPPLPWSETCHAG